jgi:hypothetical protein
MKKLIGASLLILLSGCMSAGEPCRSSPDNCAEAKRMIMRDALYYRSH